ncbi:hypothetical protein Syun_021498 [Stephania yunnanensis]|uniref:Uncharacterized protein n=1 Tax=Stephania yunnanensis TaxID=152371 RepID=A0AAP0NSB6_9MAGN
MKKNSENPLKLILKGLCMHLPNNEDTKEEQGDDKKKKKKKKKRDKNAEATARKRSPDEVLDEMWSKTFKPSSTGSERLAYFGLINREGQLAKQHSF